MKVDSAAQEQLARQVAALEVEGNKLREDLAFFESLLPARAGAKGVVIRSFRVQPEGTPNEHRYRLLVQQAGKPEQDFAGTVQLQVNYTQGGRSFALAIPEAQAPADSALKLAFRHYQRLEGSFTLPDCAIGPCKDRFRGPDSGPAVVRALRRGHPLGCRRGAGQGRN
jgi:hypothetical protein